MEKLPGYDAWKTATPDELEEEDDEMLWAVTATIVVNRVTVELFDEEIPAVTCEDAIDEARKHILNEIEWKTELA